MANMLLSVVGNTAAFYTVSLNSRKIKVCERPYSNSFKNIFCRSCDFNDSPFYTDIYNSFQR